MAYLHKAMPHSNRKNTPLVHGITEEPHGDADQKPDTKEHLLSDSSYVKFKNRYNQLMTEMRIVVTSEECEGTDKEGKDGTLGGYTNVLYLDLGGC